MLIKDIARIAGVGIGTVSRVINNHPDVSDKTRAKVLRVIEENNYVPNSSARFLKMNSSKNIGVLVRGVSNPFFSEIIDIIRAELTKAGYFIILKQNDQEEEKEEISGMKSFIRDNKLVGLISLGARVDKIENQTFEKADAPIVFAASGTIHKENIDNFSTVTINNEKAAYNAVKYLIEKGHKKIAIMLGNPKQSTIENQRLEGYKKALEDAGLIFTEENILFGDFDYEKAYNEMKMKLEEKKGFTAIFSISDIMSIGVAKAILESGLEIGKDVAIIGFDGMDITRFYNPSLSTVEQPRKEIAKHSVELILDLIKNKSEHKHIILETRLIERDSSK
ncbi:MAG: LacI family DNA-binding transcriptional regulator [Sarcina sp.]